jgi:cell division septation protein DedD
MDGPPLEDVDQNVERWREKIEVKLDNRQVFFLFFGSAVVACMLFVLGVMVGKRIESRGQAEAPVLQDPLAALDRAHQPPPGVAAPDPALTFPSTLGLGGAPRLKGSGAHSLSTLPKVLPKAPVVAKSAPAPKPIAVAKPIPAPKPIAVAKPAPAVAPPVDPAKAKGKYTLQLSTVATSADAEALVQKYPGAFVIAADVPGKGMVYRVRLGNYGSYKDAVAAKDSFEKQHSTIALIAAR